MVVGDAVSTLAAFSMDFETCFKVHNLSLFTLKASNLVMNDYSQRDLACGAVSLSISYLKLAPVPCAITEWPMATPMRVYFVPLCFNVCFACAARLMFWYGCHACSLACLLTSKLPPKNRR